MKRVMFVTNSLSGGGAERAMNLASNELCRRNWAIALIPINDSPPDYIDPISEVFPLGRKWRGGIVDTVLSYIRFNRIVLSWKPDVVVVTCDLPEFFGAFLLAKKRLVIVEEASFPWGTREVFGRTIRKLLEIRGAKTVAASPHLQIWPHRHSADVVIQNAITPFQTDKVSKTKMRGPVRLNFIGRLSLEKRPNWLIEVCESSGFKGRIIGDGGMKQSLIDSASMKAIDIEFTGFLKDPWASLEEEELLIVPSVFEGDGLVVIEAMKKGVPLLLSDIPDFRRFELPEKHYCADVTAFASRALEYSNKLEELVVPPDISSKIFFSRTPSSIGDKWEEFLNSI